MIHQHKSLWFESEKALHLVSDRWFNETEFLVYPKDWNEWRVRVSYLRISLTWMAGVTVTPYRIHSKGCRRRARAHHKFYVLCSIQSKFSIAWRDLWIAHSLFGNATSVEKYQGLTPLSNQCTTHSFNCISLDANDGRNSEKLSNCVVQCDWVYKPIDWSMWCPCRYQYNANSTKR